MTPGDPSWQAVTLARSRLQQYYPTVAARLTFLTWAHDFSLSAMDPTFDVMGTHVAVGSIVVVHGDVDNYWGLLCICVFLRRYANWTVEASIQAIMRWPGERVSTTAGVREYIQQCMPIRGENGARMSRCVSLGCRDMACDALFHETESSSPV